MRLAHPADNLAGRRSQGKGVVKVLAARFQIAAAQIQAVGASGVLQKRSTSPPCGCAQRHTSAVNQNGLANSSGSSASCAPQAAVCSALFGQPIQAVGQGMGDGFWL